eukprot:scaffold11894_cov267-Chaetoceros_neogracile.AAC.2
MRRERQGHELIITVCQLFETHLLPLYGGAEAPVRLYGEHQMEHNLKRHVQHKSGIMVQVAIGEDADRAYHDGRHGVLVEQHALAGHGH